METATRDDECITITIIMIISIHIDVISMMCLSLVSLLSLCMPCGMNSSVCKAAPAPSPPPPLCLSLCVHTPNRSRVTLTSSPRAQLRPRLHPRTALGASPSLFSASGAARGLSLRVRKNQSPAPTPNNYYNNTITTTVIFEHIPNNTDCYAYHYILHVYNSSSPPQVKQVRVQ